MALVLADRVLETSTSEGLGTFALAGAQTGYQTFLSGIGDGNTCYYTINGQTTEQWEVGIGTVGAGTLARTTLISSNTGSFINFVAGVKNVFVTQPASKSIYKDANGNAIPLGSASATQLDITAQGDLRLQDTTGGEYVAIQAPATLASSYTLTMPTDDGTAGQALVTDGSGVLSWSSAASGDVYGPASATDNAVARYDGTTGKIIQNSAVTIADDGATVIAANSSSDGLRITQTGAGNALLVEDSANPDASPFIIDNAGNVGVGATPTANLSVAGAGPQIRLDTVGSGSTYSMYRANNTLASPTTVASEDAFGRFKMYGYDGTAYTQSAEIGAFVDGTPGTNDMPGRLVFSTTADGASSPTERMRIDSAGRVGIGSAAPSTVPGATLLLSKSITGGVVGAGIAVSATIASDVTAIGRGFSTDLAIQNATFTIPDLQHFVASQGTKGASATITNQYGFNASSSLTGATNNYGFYSNIASGTGRWNFYAAGTAANVFAGTTSIGGLVGAESLRVTPVASAVNYLQAAGAVTTGSPVLSAQGSDTNIDITLTPKGTGSVTTASPTIISANSATNALRITQIGAGNALLVEDSANPDASPFVIDASGNVIQDKTTARTNYFAGTTTAQFQGSTFAAVDRGGAFDAGPAFILSKNRGATGGNTVVVADDTLGQISFQGADGTNLIPGASIQGQVDGTPGANDMPGRLIFATTADGASSPTERMRINNAGRVGIGGAAGTGEMLALRNTAETTATVFGFRNVSSINQATTTTAYGISDQTQILAPAALTNLFRFRAASGSFSGTVTNQYGYAADAGLTGATNNYGFHSNIASGANRFNFFAAGTAANVFVGTTSIGGNPGAESLRVTPVASAVNYLNVQGQITTGGPSLNAAGSDTNIDLIFVTKGTGSSQFYTNSNVLQFLVGHTASAVNYLRVTGGATGTAAIMSAAGTDTNIDIAFTPKGTGVLSFGTYTAGILAQSGYITIKDAAGNTRNLLVG